MLNVQIDPVLARWGPLSITWHGLFLAAGVALGCLLFVLRARRQGQDLEVALQLIVWVVCIGYLGARLLHVFLYEPATYLDEPFRILAIHTGGLSVYGGLVGGTLAVIVFAHRRRLSFWLLADACMVGIVAGELVGRIGCTLAGDVAGVPTDGSWGLVYWHPGASVPAELIGLPTFPAPVAMQIWNAGLLILLLFLQKHLALPGTLFLTGMILYSAGRFVINVWQIEETIILGLKPTQLVAVLGVGLAATCLGILLWRARTVPN